MMAFASKYLLNGTTILSVAVAVLYGLYVWEGKKVEWEKLRHQGLEKSLTQAQLELDRTAEVADYNAKLADSFKAEVSRQYGTIRTLEKKSTDRLRENNDLRRKISNVPASENSPVSAHIEHVLDAQRMRSSVPGKAGPDRGDEVEGDGKADPSGHDLPGTSEPTS